MDLSASYLRWARDNLQLNQFDDSRHELIEMDATQYLQSLDRNRQFDLAVVDPPTYSNSKKLAHAWDVQRDHVELLQQVIDRLTAGGTLFFSTNFRRFKFDEDALRGVTIREISKQTVPEDFRNKRIHRCWRMQKTP